MGLFLGRNLRNARNDVTVNAYQEWEHQARELFTSQHFDLIRNNTKLFTDRANKDRDIRNITFRYLLSEFGYPALHMSQNLDSLVQNYTQDAVNHYLSQKRALRTLNAIQSERERIREQIEREKEYVLDDDMYKEFVDLINDFTKDIEESIEKKQHRRQSMLNDIVEYPIRTVQRHHAAKLAIQNLTERLHELEEIGDDVQEVSAAQSHSNELLRKVDELEHQRVSKRRNEFREWLERRAHSQEEIDKLEADAIRFSQSKENIQLYFDDYPIDNERISKTLDSLKPNTRVDVTRFSNDEREILKPEMLKKLEQLFHDLTALDSVQIRFGRRDGEVRYAPMIRTNDDAYKWLKNWISRTIMIDYNEETHIPLTSGDRDTTSAPLWSVDWFEIVVKDANDKTATVMGYSKYYFKREDKPVTISNVQYSEDAIMKILERYQIADHPPTVADKYVLVPCLIHGRKVNIRRLVTYYILASNIDMFRSLQPNRSSKN